MVIIDGKVKHVTERASLVEVQAVDGIGVRSTKEVWFPLSLCPDLEHFTIGEEVEFDCPMWLAEEKDLI